MEDNLRAAAWQGRRRGEHDADMIDEAFAAFPTLAPRRAERAGNLSGGQQQMLALAMAIITRPKLFLIDELSLGLSPIVVEQLLGAIETMRQAGTAILLVEQSMNVAVSVADRVYVMECGPVRFSGSAEELAPTRAAVVDLPRRRPRPLWCGGSRSATVGDQRSATSPSSRSAGSPSASGESPPSTTCRSTPATGRSSGSSAPTAQEDDALRRRLRLPGSRRRPGRLAGVDVTDRSAAARARLGLGRSFQDSRLFSALTVRDALAVSLERFTDVGDPFNAVLRLPALVRTEAAVSRRVDELLDLFGLDRFADSLVSELSTGSRRLVDLAGVVALQPSVVLLDEPSSGVAQREVEAMVALLRTVRRPARRHASGRRARHRVHRRAGRPPGGDGPGRRAASGAPRDVLSLARGRRGLPRLRPAVEIPLGTGVRPPGPRPRRWTLMSDPGPPPIGAPLAAGEPAAHRRARRPHRGRAGRRRGGRHRERATRRHDPTTAGGASARTGSRSTVPSPMPRRPRRARPAPTTGVRTATTRPGRLKMPTGLRAALRPGPSGGANGGATSAGVTGSTHQRRLLPAAAGRPGLGRSRAPPAPAHRLATAQAYVAMFNRVFEMYGRHVNLIPFTASGADSDPVAAHADAVTVAEQHHAFASINGPGETTAYEDELARLHVLCMACGDSATYGQIKQNAPYQWANLPTADTSLNETVDYVIAKLNGKDAVWAGDPAHAHPKRTFIVVNETSEPPAPGTAELTGVAHREAAGGPRQHGPADDLTYTLDLTTLPTQAATLAEKLKSLRAPPASSSPATRSCRST